MTTSLTHKLHIQLRFNLMDIYPHKIAIYRFYLRNEMLIATANNLSFVHKLMPIKDQYY